MTDEGGKPDKPAPKKGKKAAAAKKGDGDAATPTPKRQKAAKAKEPKAQSAKEQGGPWNVHRLREAGSMLGRRAAPTPGPLPAPHLVLQRRRMSRCSMRGSA